MIGLIITIIIGLGIAYLSRNNTTGINITFGDYKFFNIPLTVITVGTYLLGVVLAWIIEIPQTVVTAFQIMGLGRTIRSGNNSIIQLQNKINKLEAENIKLHERNQAIIDNKKAGEIDRPNIIHNFLHRLRLR